MSLVVGLGTPDGDGRKSGGSGLVNPLGPGFLVDSPLLNGYNVQYLESVRDNAEQSQECANGHPQ